MPQKTECPKCGEMSATPVCTHCHVKVRERTAAEARAVGVIPEPDITKLRWVAKAVSYGTPGDREDIAWGTI